MYPIRLPSRRKPPISGRVRPQPIGIQFIIRGIALADGAQCVNHCAAAKFCRNHSVVLSIPSVSPIFGAHFKTRLTLDGSATQVSVSHTRACKLPHFTLTFAPVERMTAFTTSLMVDCTPVPMLKVSPHCKFNCPSCR